jgi:hypothetical protein
MQGKLWIDLAEHFLQPVAQFPVPRQKFRPAVNVRGLVYLILFEPPSYASGNGVGSTAGEKLLIQRDERIAKESPFGRFNGRDVATDAVPKCHICLRSRTARNCRTQFALIAVKVSSELIRGDDGATVMRLVFGCDSMTTYQNVHGDVHQDGGASVFATDQVRQIADQKDTATRKRHADDASDC